MERFRAAGAALRQQVWLRLQFAHTPADVQRFVAGALAC